MITKNRYEFRVPYHKLGVETKIDRTPFEVLKRMSKYEYGSEQITSYLD